MALDYELRVDRLLNYISDVDVNIILVALEPYIPNDLRQALIK